MAMVLSGDDTHHRGMAGGNPLCSAAIHVSMGILTYDGRNCKGYFPKVVYKKTRDFLTLTLTVLAREKIATYPDRAGPECPTPQARPRAYRGRPGNKAPCGLVRAVCKPEAGEIPP